MPPDPALLDRTLASIRSNFESLRRFDPIPALMAESPPGPPEEFGSGKSPVPPVSAFSHPNCRRLVSSSILEDGKPVLGRDLWVVASEPSVDRLKLAAEAAAGFTTVLRESVGIPKSRADSALNHWFWTVFEVAAANPPYSVLRLKGGGVFRTAVGGIVQASESELEEFNKRGAPSDPLEAAFLCRPYSPVRYWELKDFVEASLWALDLVAVALPAVIERERGNPETSREALLETAEPRKPRGPSICERLAALHKSEDEADKDFVLKSSVRELADRLQCSEGGLNESSYYNSRLRGPRADIYAKKAQGKAALRYDPRAKTSKDSADTSADQARSARYDHLAEIQRIDDELDKGH